MPEKQTFIYYITGANVDAVKNSPMLEKLNKKSFECLFMVDPLDEYVVQQLSEFEGKKLQSVTKDVDLKLSKANKEKHEKIEEEYKDLTKWLKDTYGDKVEKVVISHKLTKSPAAISTGQYGWTANMERIMKAQTFSDPNSANWMAAKKTLEINPRHPIIKELAAKVKEDPTDKSLVDLANVMLDSSLLVSGFAVESPAELSSRLMRVMAGGLKVDPAAEPEEEEEEEEEEKKDDADAAEDGESEGKPEGGDGAASSEDSAASAGDEGEDMAKKLAGDDKDEL